MFAIIGVAFVLIYLSLGSETRWLDKIWYSVQAWLIEDLSQIVDGYVELIKLNVWK